MARAFAGSTDKILRAAGVLGLNYPCTLFGRIKITNLAAGSHSVLKLSVAGGLDGHQIYVRTAGSARAITNATTSGVATTANTISADGLWHTVIGEYVSATDRKCYLDNGTAGTDTTSKAPVLVSHTEIGYRADTGTENSGHEIGEVAVWNIADLSLEERAALHGGVSPLLVRPLSLRACIKVDTEVIDLLDNAAFSITGTTVTSHPALWLPRIPTFTQKTPTVAGGVVVNPFTGRGGAAAWPLAA